MYAIARFLFAVSLLVVAVDAALAGTARVEILALHPGPKQTLRNWKLLDEASASVSVRWGDTSTSSTAAAPDWLGALRAEQQDALSAEARDRSQWTSSDFGLNLLMLVIPWSVPGYAALQVYALRKLDARWLRLAKLPLWIMAPALAVSLYALLQGSNLWPMWLLFASPFAFAYLAALLFAWRRSAPRQPTA